MLGFKKFLIINLISVWKWAARKTYYIIGKNRPIFNRPNR